MTQMGVFSRFSRITIFLFINTGYYFDVNCQKYNEGFMSLLPIRPDMADRPRRSVRFGWWFHLGPIPGLIMGVVALDTITEASSPGLAGTRRPGFACQGSLAGASQMSGPPGLS
jgi:hypothetical protein